MSNKDTYKRKHRYLDNQINTLEKHNHYNRTLISSLKKKKLRLKDKMISDSRESARNNKYNLHEYIKRAMSMTAWQSFSYMIYWIHMLHKISQLCDKVDSLKKTADHLRFLKYGENKAPRIEIDNTIATIQAECLLIANDKSDYNEPHDQSDKE